VGQQGTAGLDRRLLAFRMLVIVAFALLTARLWHIQLARGIELRTQAEANSFVTREIEADRGVIYDSEGRQIVRNSPRFTVSVVPAALPEHEDAQLRQLRKLARILGIDLRSGTVKRIGTRTAGGQDTAALRLFDADEPSLEELLPRTSSGRVDRSLWNPVPVARNVSRSAAFALFEASVEMPFITIGESSVREYPTGPTLGQVLGFTGSIPRDLLGDYLSQDYRIYDIVGRDGLEATYERYLRGRKGEKIVEIDATGREQRQIGEARAPMAGHSLELTIDSEFQRAAEEALARGLLATGARSGAAVALDPRSGAVRSIVSLPNYDNNMFSTGARPDEFAELLNNPDLPLLNRAITGQYAPGSTFKLVTAAGALEEELITRRTRIFDPGYISLTNEYNPEESTPFFCWLRSGHGSLDVVGAIAHSCNVFFYQIAGSYYEEGHRQDGLGSDRLAHYARAFGLGSASGIELYGEASGRVPTKDWLAEWTGDFWTTGLTYDMGIGQANTLVTPLQMARVVAAVANGGRLYEPHLVDRVVRADGEVVSHPGGDWTQVPVSPQHLATVREGMRGAVLWGTALPAWTHLPTKVDVAGKTGTAIFCDYIGDSTGGKIPCRTDREGNLLTHAWFVAFAPYEDPEIAVAVFIDGSGLDYLLEGSRHAAPVAAEILRSYFDLPAFSPTPTATPCSDCTPTPEPALADGRLEDTGEPQPGARDAGPGEGQSSEQTEGRDDG
jgi:penicillin-binding protein 2